MSALAFELKPSHHALPKCEIATKYSYLIDNHSHL